MCTQIYMEHKHNNDLFRDYKVPVLACYMKHLPMGYTCTADSDMVWCAILISSYGIGTAKIRACIHLPGKRGMGKKGANTVCTKYCYT